MKQVFHGDHQTALMALDTLPALLKPGKPKVPKVLKKTKPHQRVLQLVTIGMVAYLNALGKWMRGCPRIVKIAVNINYWKYIIVQILS